jgi:hypothetical protein
MSTISATAANGTRYSVTLNSFDPNANKAIPVEKTENGVTTIRIVSDFADSETISTETTPTATAIYLSRNTVLDIQCLGDQNNIETEALKDIATLYMLLPDGKEKE